MGRLRSRTAATKEGGSASRQLTHGSCPPVRPGLVDLFTWWMNNSTRPRGIDHYGANGAVARQAPRRSTQLGTNPRAGPHIHAPRSAPGYGRFGNLEKSGRRFSRYASRPSWASAFS